MGSEKVKEIKKALKYCYGECDCDCPFYKNGKSYEECKSLLLFEALTLIKELESENERIKQSGKNLAFVNEKVIKQNNELKDRIVELEEALLDMVVQFCQMSKEGYLHHTFMSAEENAFDVLDIEYGEKVDDVYERFNKKWGRED